jgi:cell division protease FtsH
MSDKLGPMMFGQKEEMIFLGREISEQRDYSEAVAEEIDSEVRAIVNWANDEARRLLREHRDKLETLARRLLEIETVDAEEFLVLMGEAPQPGAVPPTSQSPKARPQTDDGSDRLSLGAAPSPA